MKISLIKITLFVLILFIACNSGQSKQTKPEKVHRIVYEIHPNEWYKTQSELWRAEIEKNPGNPEAWYNYYNANRYANFENLDSKSKREKLAQIIDDMGKDIPGSYEYYLLKYWNSWDMKDMGLIEKAYELNPERPDTYYPFISKAKIEGNQKTLDEFCQKLYYSKDISPWLINYNYNVLMSLEQDAILITNGDNDTYPVWMLQSVKGIRKDVTVLNASLSRIKDYLINNLKEKNISVDYEELNQLAKNAKGNGKGFAELFLHELVKKISLSYPKVPVYFALTVYKPYFKPFEKDLYVTGLTNKYSKGGIDNFALLKKNIEDKFRLDYLNFDWYTEDFPGKSIMNMLHTNYIVPFIMLAEHYKTSGENEKALKLKEISIKIAEQSDNRELKEYILEKNI